MSFASDSPATTPTGNKPISACIAGDNITVWTPNGTETKQVIFSSGTKDRHHQMVYIAVDNGEHNYYDIIVSAYQPMMMADQKLKQAWQLQPGDELLNADSRPIQIRLVNMGEFTAGVHSVQTNGAEKGTDGHLIIVNGLVCGDFQVEVNFKDIKE
jgi:hypothetical protein